VERGDGWKHLDGLRCQHTCHSRRGEILLHTTDSINTRLCHRISQTSTIVLLPDALGSLPISNPLAVEAKAQARSRSCGEASARRPRRRVVGLPSICKISGERRNRRNSSVQRQGDRGGGCHQMREASDTQGRAAQPSSRNQGTLLTAFCFTAIRSM